MQRLRHTPSKELKGGQASLETLSDEKDTQKSFMSVTLRAEENSLFFYNDRPSL